MSVWNKILHYRRFLKFWKYKKFWKFFGKRVGIVVFCLILIGLSMYVKGMAEVIASITSSLIIFVIAFDLFSLLIFYEKRIKYKEISKNTIDIDKDLFDWSGSWELSDEIINRLFSENNPEKSLEKLFDLKEKIKKACLNDKNNLFLLKKYIGLKSKDNTSSNTKSILLTAAIGFIVTICTQINSENNILVNLHNILTHSEEALNITTLTTYITYCTYGLIALMAFLSLKQILTKSKSRLRLITIIIDSCIEEIKEQE